jgi:aminopeptidase N
MASTEITRAECRERARLLRVRSYDVTLDLTRKESFGSVSVIRFDCAEPGAASHADLMAQAVHEIRLNGAWLEPAATWSGGRIALPALAAHNELRVVAYCRYTGSGTGMHRSAGGDDGGSYVYGKLAQAYARTAYACFDQPDLKAEFTFKVVAPAQWTVLSNAPAAGPPSPAGDDRAMWEFLPTTRLPTFTTTVVAGDYHLVTASHVTPGGQRIPLELACRAGMAAHLDADALFELAGQGLDFYTGWFGAAYPYRKYGQVFVPELSCGASEDAGCVLVSEQYLPRSRVTAAMTETRAGTLLHEMAHMWFGDLVTEQWWDDLWLSESFADFCEYHARSRLGRGADAWSTFSMTEKARGFADDQLPSAHPVASDAATLSEAIANFDMISYAKGASVLRQLAGYAGEQEFFAGLRGYLDRHAFGNARLADLIDAVAASSGRDLAAWSRAWLQTAGPSTLRAQFRTDASGAFTEFAVVQEGTVMRPHRIAVGLYQRSGGTLARTGGTLARTGGTLARTGGLAVEVTGARTEVPELIGTRQPDLILLNDDDAGYVLVRFDPRSLRTVLESVGEVPGAEARAVCWNTVIDMTRQGELPVPAFAAVLARGMAAEPSVPVLQALHGHAEELITQLAGPGQAREARRRLADAAMELLAAAEPGSDHQLAWIQLLAWTATDGDQLDLIAALLAGRTALPGLLVDAELRWSLLQRLTATGRADDAAIDAQLAADPGDAGRRSAAASRAAMPDAAHKEAAWRLLTGGQAGPKTLAAVARGFMQPEQGDLLAGYAARYLAEIEDIWARSSGHLRVQLGTLLFPYPAAAPELPRLIEEFLAAAPRDPDLARMLRDRQDAVRRALKSRALT